MTASRAEVVIDTDPGLDDALALLLAWSSPEIRVQAVTTVAGNVPVAQGTTNVFRLLALRRPTPMPVVAVGAPAPLARPLVSATRYHGEDGLGDLGDWPDVEPAPATGRAADLLVEAARRHGAGLTVVALGPLTNVALAVEADRAAMRGIGRLVVMGGAVDVPGNVTPTAEFNFHVDPDAAARVFEAGLPIELVPLDATRQAVVARKDLMAALAKRPGPLASRIAGFTERGFRVDVSLGTRGMILHDPLAVGVAADPTLVEWETARLTIGPEGESRRAGGPANCRFARVVHRQRFLTTFLERLCPASS